MYEIFNLSPISSLIIFFKYILKGVGWKASDNVFNR